MKAMKQTYLVLMLSVSAAAIAVAAEERPADPAAATQAPAAAPAPASRLPYAWRPVRAQFVPVVKQKEWVRTPIDAFILSKLEAKGLKPSPDADRATFIRRATLDVWGVVPTPDEVAAFVNDASPDAYEKLVDRLLASTRYGERQARRWLDLVRYADSAGFQGDQTRPNAYRYRDYVINAFNSDKPYSRFLQEQVAGDELAPGDQEALTATGFLGLYADNSNSRDLVQRKYQITTDIVDTLGTAVLGTSVACARCHNHKYDKLTQKDYFSLQAFFANTAIDEKTPVAVKGDEEKRFEAQQAKWEEAVKDIKAKQKELIDSVREQALTYHKERYLTDSRESIFKPEKDWNALDRWVNHRLAAVTDDDTLAGYFRYAGEDKEAKDYNPEYLKKAEEYRKLTAELRKFDNLRPNKGSVTLTSATELGHPDAPPTYIFFGGNHERKLDEVQPAFPEALSSEKPDIKPTETSSGRRLALANWLASPTNPLTARVYVNRIWNEYFGKGDHRDGQRLRQGRRQADQSRTARLSGGQLRQGRVEREEASSSDPAVERLSPVVGAARGCRERRRGRQAARRVPAQASRRRADPRLLSGGRRPARGQGWWIKRVPAGSGQFERGPGLARVEEPAGSKPPQHLRVHAAQRSLSASGNLRHVERPAGA